MRLFIAIDLSDKCKKYLSTIILKLKKNYPDLLFVSEEKLHLTLKFLGEVPDDKLQTIIKKLSSVKFKQISASITEFGVFPDENYFRVLWIGLQPEKPFYDLQKQVDNILQDLFEKDAHFQPHITIARIKFVKDKKSFIDFVKKIKLEPIKFDVTEFKLVKSVLQKGGSKYDVVKTFPSNLEKTYKFTASLNRNVFKHGN